ncbi:hypothetical protein JXA84_06600 [candidate division WOR-3 bacterium]|nr:hypothetical protein [candidate division WOR-3 bacterium]
MSGKKNIETKKKDKEIEVKKNQPTEGIGLTTINYLIIAVGVLSVIIGYVFLRRGSITLAPILLIAGYVVLIPLGLILNFQKKLSKSTSDGSKTK